jgi:hypothetical protein
MNYLKYISVFFLICFTFAESSAAEQKIAMVAKTRGTVSYRHSDENAFSKDAKTGTVLVNGDIIKTGKESFVALIFLDDKSQVKLMANCDLEILGEKIRNNLNKELSMNYGQLKAEVSKQRKGEFRISTPTSVASVKGTDFWIISDPNSGDKIIGLSGIIELMNQITGYTTTVGANQTGISLPDGSIDTQVTNPDDIPEDELLEEKEIQQMKIQFQNSRGESKNIIIEYR